MFGYYLCVLMYASYFAYQTTLHIKQEADLLNPNLSLLGAFPRTQQSTQARIFTRISPKSHLINYTLKHSNQFFFAAGAKRRDGVREWEDMRGGR